MKRDYFNNFIEGLTNEETREDFECMGFAFLSCTERQICKVIDVYVSKGLASYNPFTERVSYGCGNAWSYPLSEYLKYGKHTPEEIPTLN